MSKITFEVPLPRELHAALKEAAGADERSMASAVRVAIKRYVESCGVSVNSVTQVSNPAPKPAPLTPERTRTIAEEWADEDDD